MSQPMPPQSAMTRTLLVLVLLALAASCGYAPTITFAPSASPTPTPTPSPTPSVSVFEVSGVVTVTAQIGDHSNAAGDPCDAYIEDFGAYNPIIVYDGTGKKIAVGYMQRGASTSESGAAPFTQCRQAYRIENVPEGEPVYDLQIGGRCYEKVTASSAQMHDVLNLSFLGTIAQTC